MRDDLYSYVVCFTVLRSESIEMLMTQRLPAEEKSTKEQLKTLCVKLLSLVSYHRSFFQFSIFS